jgi:NAD(P)-dependent dehydrogenase (short-subunit alcohol dehydrogenase family)
MTDGDGLRGKRVVITGATNGIGLAAARELARRGADLAILARDERRGSAVAELIKAAGSDGHVDVLHVDLASQASIRKVAAEILDRYPRIDVLVNNAGAIYAGRQVSPDGIELTWAVNHLAPFLLTNLLLDRLRASAPARIITTSSDAHQRASIPFDDLNAERSYRTRGFGRYGETKLANILFTFELARRLEGSGLTANCYHPGSVATGFNRNNGLLMNVAMTITKPFSRTPEKGAETLVWLAEAPGLATETGGYYVDMRRVTPSPAAQDMEAARRLWEISARQVGLEAAGDG